MPSAVNAAASARARASSDASSTGVTPPRMSAVASSTAASSTAGRSAAVAVVSNVFTRASSVQQWPLGRVFDRQLHRRVQAVVERLEIAVDDLHRRHRIGALDRGDGVQRLLASAKQLVLERALGVVERSDVQLGDGRALVQGDVAPAPERLDDRAGRIERGVLVLDAVVLDLDAAEEALRVGDAILVAERVERAQAAGGNSARGRGEADAVARSRAVAGAITAYVKCKLSANAAGPGQLPPPARTAPGLRGRS